MAIWKRLVEVHENSGKLFVPQDLVGKEVWVISEEDVDDLKELIQSTLLYRKAYKHDQTEFLREFNVFRRQMEARVSRLEDIITKH